ncbi:MAG: STAS domain-containing protein [Lachnospiraceae bacterium]|nr:STAS domain-containing protein [Lachnospiraceae bacterium]
MFYTEIFNYENKLTVELVGDLDAVGASQLEALLKKNLSGVTELIFDAKNLESISSEGFRVLLFAQKIMDKQGTLVIKNVSKEVIDSFEETGFCTILTIV